MSSLVEKIFGVNTPSYAPAKEGSLLTTLFRSTIYLVPVIGLPASFANMFLDDDRNQKTHLVFLEYGLNLTFSTVRELAVISLAITGIAAAIFILPLYAAVPLFLVCSVTALGACGVLAIVAYKIAEPIILVIEELVHPVLHDIGEILGDIFTLNF